MSSLIQVVGWDDAKLRKHRWQQHPDFDGVWRRDGGEYMSTSQAIRIEEQEQEARDRIKARKSETDASVRHEVEARRRSWDEHAGIGRVEQKRVRS